MMDREPSSVDHLPPGNGFHRSGRWSRLCLKELRETLRDRRTLFTLVLMPLLVYPILSMVFQRSLISIGPSDRPDLVIGVSSEEIRLRLKRTLYVGDAYIRQTRQENGEQQRVNQGLDSMADEETPELPDVNLIVHVVHDELADQVENEQIDLGVLPEKGNGPGQLTLIYREGSSLSQRALRFVEQRLQAANELSLRQRLWEAGKSGRLMFHSERQAIPVSTSVTTLSTLVPMILILMTVTGAVYPAIDLTAGERERGTLEMLMAAPVPRLKLLLAKYIAVVSVACLTAIVNLLAMTITLQATGLGRVLFGEAGLSPLRIVQILALLVMFAAFFSAVLLVLTSFARSFKEAQAYLIPLMLLSLGPGIVSLLPGLELRGLLVITPVSNMVLLARDLCGEGVNPLMAMVAILATTLYTLAAIAIAARIFGADAVLSGSQSDWSELLLSGRQAGGVSSVQGALFCLAILFPVYFLVANALGQIRDVSLSIRLVATGVATSLLFGAIPWFAARLQRLDLRQAFQWQRASALGFLAAILLGLTLWPLAHEVFMLNQMLGLVSIRPEQLEAVQKLLSDWREISPVWILLSMAVAPAVFEELFFRGYLFSALTAATSRRNTILASSLLFGLFHVVSTNALSTERFLPSTFLGLVLGWLCYHTGSVLPGIVLHACHNGLLLLIAYYRDALIERGWGIEEQSHLPLTWIGGSVGGLLLGMWLISKAQRQRVEEVTGGQIDANTSF